MLSDVGLTIPAISTSRRSVMDPERGKEYLAYAHRPLDVAAELGVPLGQLWLLPGADGRTTARVVVLACRGLARRPSAGGGRLLWLKAFRRVVVDSIFEANGTGLKRRTFVFDAGSGVASEKENVADREIERLTVVHLEGFDHRYRTYTRKTAKAIAEDILEHCLWYFLRPGGAPEIRVEDLEDTVSLREAFEAHMHSSGVAETISIKGQMFDLLHVKLRSNSLAAHTIALCADNRLVVEERLASKVPGLHGKLADEKGEFIYSCYVSSPFLDEMQQLAERGLISWNRIPKS